MNTDILYRISTLTYGRDIATMRCLCRELHARMSPDMPQIVLQLLTKQHPGAILSGRMVNIVITSNITTVEYSHPPTYPGSAILFNNVSIYDSYIAHTESFMRECTWVIRQYLNYDNRM